MREWKGDTMSVKMTNRQVSGVTVVDCEGRITLGEGSSVFREHVKSLLAKGGKKILLNLTEASYTDASGIGEMVSAHTTTTNAGSSLKLLGLNGELLKNLKLTQLYKVFEIFDDEDAAVRSFQ